MSTITIIEGNNNDKDNTRVLMVKGETGATISTIAKTSTSGLTDTYTVTLSDGRTQTFTVTNGKGISSIEKTGTSGLVDTYTITFNDNTTHTFTVTNGYSPSANVSKSNGVTTVTITDKDGTTTAEINDAVGYEVPAGAVIGWNTAKVSYTCNGTETGGYYLINNTLSYYFTMPTVEAGDLLIFDPTDESLTLNGETIVTTPSGTGTELTFTDYIPAGYVETQETFGGGGETLKVGTILEYTGTTAPNGYMFCDGSAISRTTYSQLFAVIGTSYGAGDGSTTFNIPNFKGRVAVGYDSTQSEFDTLGETGGEKTHTLTTDEMPAHKHSVNTIYPFTAGNKYTGVPNSDASSHYNTNDTGVVNNTGGGQPHNNLQPYIVVNYIIKVSQTTATSAQIVNSYSTSTEDGYSCNYLNEKDITSKITKNASKVGTVYFMTAYQKGSRCYFSAQIDLLAEGSNLFTIDNSIKPKYTEIGNGVNYQSGSSQPMIIKITANSSTIDCNVYATAINSYATIHLEWEI